MGGEGGLVGHLVGRRVRTPGRARMDVIGGVVDGSLHAGLNLGRDTDHACRADVLAGFGNRDGLFAELHGEVTVDAGLEGLHDMTFILHEAGLCQRLLIEDYTTYREVMGRLPDMSNS